MEEIRKETRIVIAFDRTEQENVRCLVAVLEANDVEIVIPNVCLEEFEIIEQFPIPEPSKDRSYPKNPFVGGKRGQRTRYNKGKKQH